MHAYTTNYATSNTLEWHHMDVIVCQITGTWTTCSTVRSGCQNKVLTHWGRVTHICVDKLNIIGSDNGLSPGRRQAIIWTNVGILLIGSLRTHFSEISIGIQTFSLKKMHLKMSSAQWRPFCLGLNVLKLRITGLVWGGSTGDLKAVIVYQIQRAACDTFGF